MNKQELRTNKQELISKYELLKNSYNFKAVATDAIISDLKRLDEPEAGHADEAPRYVKNILARLRELPLHDREVWLKAIMGEFEQDFSHAKWREGYEQGKFEGEWAGQQLKNADKIRQELNRPVVQQFVADWYEEHKDALEFNIFDYVYRFDQNPESDFKDWFDDLETNSIQTLVNMHQFGYEVEKEKRYKVVMPNISSTGGVLTRIKHDDSWIWIDTLGTIVEGRTHTRKELEDADFGWVFDCPGVEVEEVED
nr:MAG TPA: Protein of unknown function (DUF1642) [Caudoviricetes sp.]